MDDFERVSCWASEAAGLLTAALVFGGYAWVLRRDLASKTPQTAPGILRPLREEWLRQVIRAERDLLCVQTLRNWTMTASLLASTSILAGMGALGFALSPRPLPGVLEAVSWGTPTTCRTDGLPLKILCVAALFFWSFSHFASAMRYFNHVAVCTAGTAPAEQRAQVAVAMLRKAIGHQMTGLRSLYATAAVALWSLGPVWLSLSSVLMVRLMRSLDRAPSADPQARE